MENSKNYFNSVKRKSAKMSKTKIKPSDLKCKAVYNEKYIYKYYMFLFNIVRLFIIYFI